MSEVIDRPAAADTHRLALNPHALKDQPALIERAFPAQKISVEAQKERKAGAGQTLTALGSYWKGRKPLILVRAIVLGSLLPATDNPEADLDIFEKLMAIDDEAFVRREPKLTPTDIASRIELTNPEDFFDFSGSNAAPAAFPINPEDYPEIKIRWKRGISQIDKEDLIRRTLSTLSYSGKVAICKRPEELDQEALHAPIWPDVNKHLRQFGIEARSHNQLVEQLGILRYGHRPKVGDTFCGGGSIPFEAARLGCDVYASDLNPVACMLTWGALNIIGADEATRKKIEQAQREVANAVDEEITKLGIEHNNCGDRAKAYLYCLETRCPQTGWMVPMAPSWVISKTRNVVAKLIPDPEKRRFDIEIVTGASEDGMAQAAHGTVQKGELVYELDGETYRTPVRTIRGDYRASGGETRNKLRLWEKHDFKPRSDDIFQERLYAIQWITKKTFDKTRQETYFASVTKEDLERERQVEQIVEKNLQRWQEEGLVPDMEIEPGDKTDEPIRTRGWTHWHHLFSARQILGFALFRANLGDSTAAFLKLAKLADYGSKLCRWDAGHKGSSPQAVGTDLSPFSRTPVKRKRGAVRMA